MSYEIFSIKAKRDESFFREIIASENFCEIKENLSNEKLSNFKNMVCKHLEIQFAEIMKID